MPGWHERLIPRPAGVQEREHAQVHGRHGHDHEKHESGPEPPDRQSHEGRPHDSSEPGHEPAAHAGGAPDHVHDHRHVEGTEPPGRPRIGFVGAGRVGTTLAIAFSRAGWPVTAVASRDDGRRDRARALLPGSATYSEAAAVLDDVDICFLTVPDDAVAAVAGTLRLYSSQALVHTSGSLPAGVLRPAMAAGTAVASFHPLISFAQTEQALADLAGATVALEGDEALLGVLAELAEDVGARPVRIPEDGKAAYHAAAMLASGGLVGLLDGIAELARGADLDEPAAMAIYAPLVRQTLANAERLGIVAALTGPMVRGDVGTVRSHLAAVERLAPAVGPLYRAVADRELAIAERRGDLSEGRAEELRAALRRPG